MKNCDQIKRSSALLLNVFLTLALVSWSYHPVYSAPSISDKVVGQSLVELPGHIPSAINGARSTGHFSSSNMHLALVLPLKNTDKLTDLLHRLYDVSDPLFGHFTTPSEFTERFCPSQAEYDAVVAYAHSKGFTVEATSPNRRILDVSAPTEKIESAFGLKLMSYEGLDGRSFFSPDSEPKVPTEVSAYLQGIVGLDNTTVYHPANILHRKMPDQMLLGVNSLIAGGSQIGTGYGGSLSPYDIKLAYNLNNISLTGAGQVLGLLELDGYTPSDITSYETAYGLPAVPLQNLYIDGYSGGAGSSADETTLDIELQVALAPGVSRILVYEAPNNTNSFADVLNSMANDNLAKQISISWSTDENFTLQQKSAAIASIDPGQFSEYCSLEQMAAQGQSVYVASGDHGSYARAQDPSTQPFAVSVGGTKLSLNYNGTYSSETTWNEGSSSAGGGGSSHMWAKPDYQSGLGILYSSPAMNKRDTPDVSLNADPYTGYSIYYHGGWAIYGGTSASAPLWAAFTALVNQQRVSNGASTIGFTNNPIYQIGRTAYQAGAINFYATDFHDIADGSSNGLYTASPGYDDATGWGSFNGANLLADLVGFAPPLAITDGPHKQGVLITWTTNIPSTSYLEYGASPKSLTYTNSDNSLVKSHSIYITTLLPNRGSIYYYRVRSTANNYTVVSSVGR